uniref:condensin-2 complex subunit D3-like isoform X1 n=2 Tax=Styela clava TaxID=7725 RepID=UPI00193A10A0|nr:condensin-2 complex subunit D3-like isoform X1 [Styela clava]
MNENLILDIFQSLELTNLDEEWVDRMHSSEFTDDPEIDIDIPSSAINNLEDLNLALRNGSKLLANLSGQTRCSLLNELIKIGITSKVIQSWIYYLFHVGLKMSASFEQTLLCLLAADFYFLLLQLPGMSSSQLHHAILFEKAVNSLQMVTQVDATMSEEVGRKRKANVPLSQSQKRRKASNDKNTQEEEDHGNVVITPSQMANLYRLLNLTLTDFCKYLASVSLRSNEVSLKHAMQVLVKIANCLKTNAPISIIDYKSFRSDGSTADSFRLPYQQAVYALFLTISVKHGDVHQLCLTLFRFILPIIIMRDANIPSSTVSRSFFQNSEIFRKLVCHLFDVHGDSVSHSISVLTQNLIAQCPDRTEFRNHLATIVSCILQHMPTNWYADFCDWLRRMAVHSKIVYRSNTLATVGKLLCMPERLNDENDSLDPDTLVSTKHSYLLKIVVGRLLDVSPSVRSRALHVLVEMMEEGIVSPTALQEVVDARGKDLESETPATNASARGKSSTPATLHTVAAPTLMNSCTVIEDNKSTLLQLLSRCVLEPKAMVRKTAVQALEMALISDFVQPTDESMTILEKKCSDPSLMVRKQAISSISLVLMHHKSSKQAQACWARGVFPAVLDAESSIQEKSAALIESTILDNLNGSEEKSNLAWDLISFLATQKGEPLRAYLQTVCRQWNRQQKLNVGLVSKFAKELETPNKSAGAWLFLRLFTLYVCNKSIADHIVKTWVTEYKKANPLMFHINSTMTLGQICKHLHEDTIQQVMDICIQRLKMPHCPIQLISYLIETICNLIETLYKEKTDGQEWPQPLMEWCKAILQDADEYLYKVVMSTADGCSIWNEHSLIHQLYITGNIGKHCATKVPKRLILSMQALLTSTECLSNMSQLQSQISASQDVLQSQPLSQFVQSGGIPHHIRAHAVINLGKICLHNVQLAKKCIPAMVRELDTCDNAMVRNNVLIILTDLCVLQTQLVDPYLGDMANCLGDESVEVRRNALILINSLLKKDYVKWRGSLIFKFLTLLCDNNTELRNLVRFSLIEQTLRRNAGDIFFRHFVESIFYLNAYTDHNIFNRFAKTDRELRLFDFSGETKKSERMSIYVFMLEHMDDEHRIKLTGKLCTDILDSVVDGVIPLGNKANDVIADTLAILCGPDLKLKCMKSASDDDQDVEGMQNEAANIAKNAMKQKIISHVVKKNLVENIMPIIIAIKNLLVAKQSPLVGNVMLCLKEIMKDYKTEVQDLLTADKQLASEIEYDLKRFDREQEERFQREHPVSVADNTPTHSATVQSENENVIASPARVQIAVNQTVTNQQTPTRHKENRDPASPAHQFLSPTTAMRRQKGLGITAVLNYARKTMNQLKINDQDQNSDGQPPSNSLSKRAISTPARKTALGDLTFSNMTEISVIFTPVEKTTDQ